MNSITRRELYDIVWSKPLKHISEQLDLKQSIIKGLCQTYSIPIPILGHWSKLEFNKESPVFPFIEDHDLDDTIDLTCFKVQQSKKLQEKNFEVNFVVLDEKKKELPIRLKDKELEVITETRKRLKEGYSYYRNHDEKSQHVDVHVTPKLIERALDFLNKFLKYARIRKFHVSSSSRGTYIGLKNKSLRVRVRECYNRVKKPNAKPFDTEDKIPNGILNLQLGEGYWRLEWRETATTKLEDKMDEILNRIEVKFLTEIQRDNDILKEKVRKRELERLVEAREELISVHLSKFKLLLKQAKKSSEVELLRKYLERLKDIKDPTEECKDWIDWSEKAIDWYDPLVNYNHPYLSDVDKDSLKINPIDDKIESWYLEYSFKDYKYDNDWETFEGIMEDE
jgi:hypothetical protein